MRPADAGRVDALLHQFHCAWAIAKKNARVNYLKGPVISFRILFPAFVHLAFAAGHDDTAATMVLSIAAMALFFTASAVGPLVTPWERQVRTFERLVTSPAALIAILGGDAGAGAAFGALLALLPLVFISGVFVPHDQMPAWGQWLSPLSPLSYCADLVRVGFGAKLQWSVAMDCAVLLGFVLLFGCSAVLLQRRTLRR
jgi:ABC-2 type transport system permease protein